MTAAPTTTREPQAADRRARGRLAAGMALAITALLTAAAAVGGLVLWTSEDLCDEVCERQSWDLNWQVVVSVGALAGAAVATVCAVTGRRRAALAFLVVATGLAWPVLADIAVDGWSHSPLQF